MPGLCSCGFRGKVTGAKMPPSSGLSEVCFPVFGFCLLLTDVGISLQMQFFAELPACPPVARFLFEITETVHTFSAYNFAKAMTANDLVEAHHKCLGSFSDFTGRCSADPANTADGLFAQ